MRVALVFLLVGLIAAAVYFGGGGGPAPAPAEGTVSGNNDVKTDSSNAVGAEPATRTEADPDDVDEPDEPEEEFQPSRPTVHHPPGSGPLVPMDITNLTPASFGKKPWFQLVTENEKWRQLWTSLHEVDGPRQDPLEEPLGPPGLKTGEEAFLVVALGERPRMDYAVELAPVESKFGEARYRLRVNIMPIPPTEVLTRPARVYLLPTAPMGKVGLVIEDEKGFELARFDPP